MGVRRRTLPRRMTPSAQLGGVRIRRPRWSTKRIRAIGHRWLPFVLALIVYGLAFQAFDPIATGDEPSYYLIAKSLAVDGDVDLTNQYASPTQTHQACPTCPFGTLSAAVDYRGDGTLRPYHYLGLPLLIAPAVAITNSQTGPRVTVLVLSALAAMLLFRLLELVVPGRRGVHWAVWIGVAFCLPVTAFASQVYPEMAAALFILVVLNVLADPTAGQRALIGAGGFAAFMPWLHVRLSILAVALTALLCIKWYRTAASSGTEPVRRRRGMIAIVAPLVMSFVVTSVFFQRWYGSPSLGAAYDKPQFAPLTDFEPAFAYRNFFGSLFNPSFGLLPWAPVLLLGIVGLGCAMRRSRVTTLVGLGAGLLYLGVSNALGVGQGTSLPARYEVVVAIGLAAPLALIATRFRAAAAATAVLAALSLAITAQATRYYLDLYPTEGGGQTVTVPLAKELARAWPRFWSVTTATFPAEVRPRKIGRVSSTPPLPAGSATVIEASVADGRGLLADGVGSGLPAGTYRASVPVARVGESVGAGLGSLRVVSRALRTASPLVVASRTIERDALPADGQFRVVDLRFDTPGDLLIDVRVVTEGRSGLRVGATTIAPITSRSPERYPSLAAVIAWVGGLIAATALVAWGTGHSHEESRAAATKSTDDVNP